MVTLQIFSTKSPSSTLSSTKIKTLLHTLIVSHVCRIVRALSKAKSVIIESLRENQPIHFIYPTKSSNKIKMHKNRKIFLGSFRLHYNWCSSSHVLPVPPPHLYNDPSWNSTISSEEYREDNNNNNNTLESQLSGYLHWLEDGKVPEKGNNNVDQEDANEIDKLADLFIASCHEKFRLEKQESCRRFQEMMARSM